MSSDRIEIDTDSRVTKIKCMSGDGKTGRTCDDICASKDQFFLQHVKEETVNGRKKYENSLTNQQQVKKDTPVNTNDMCYCIPRFISKQYI